jgi:hypothetical protein
MPMLINHIDKIARDKQRGVVYIEFCKQPDFNRRDIDEYHENLFIDYENLEIRKTLLQWFADNHIAVHPCGPFARAGRIERYRGQLYIDVPFDKNDPIYQKVENLLENEDGTMKFPQVLFFYLPLEAAMENAHHDEPGYEDNLDL